MKNVELKARITSIAEARQFAEAIGADDQGILQQTDRFFGTPSGRLKLRIFADDSSELISYHRPDQESAKTSDYYICPIDDGDRLTEVLGHVLGHGPVVKKTRHLYLYENVRIHLDEVEGLGCFLEFEAVLSDDASEESGRQQLKWLQSHFQIKDVDLIHHAYADMLVGADSE